MVPVKATNPYTMKEKLLQQGMPQDEVEKFLAYVNAARRTEAKKASDKRPVSSNTDEVLSDMAFKYHGLGLTLDGVNVVVTGNNMTMVTYHGYRNAVLNVYPEAQIDVQLVREGDTFSFGKESGKISYSHKIANPFTDTKIVGAYAIFKTKRGELMESLNLADYEKMKNASKMKFLWTQWESEFWLKSVMKRACKRYFYDVVAEIDKEDNATYGLQAGDIKEPEPDKTKQAMETLKTCATVDELKGCWKALEGNAKASPEVIRLKDELKLSLTPSNDENPTT